MLKLTEGYHPAYMQGWNENIDAANREIAELKAELTEAQQEGVKWLRIAQEFERGEERTLAEIERLENILAGGAHSCSNTCMRPVCRLRREKRELESAAREVVAFYAPVHHGKPLTKLAALLEESSDE